MQVSRRNLLTGASALALAGVPAAVEALAPGRDAVPIRRRRLEGVAVGLKFITASEARKHPRMKPSTTAVSP